MIAKDPRARKARSALAKSNAVSFEISGIYEADRQKFQAMAQDLGITFDGNNNVLDNSTNDRLDALEASSGGTKEYASFYLNGSGSTGLGSTEVTLTINSTDVNSNSSVFSLASNQITVNKTGVFEINANVYLNNSSTARVEYSMWIKKNGTEVVGSRFASYQRGYDSGMSSGINLITSVTTGDVFQIQCQLTDGSTSSGYQDANGTRFNIKEM
jgi:hypothetical protein